MNCQPARAQHVRELVRELTLSVRVSLSLYIISFFLQLFPVPQTFAFAPGPSLLSPLSSFPFRCSTGSDLSTRQEHTGLCFFSVGRVQFPRRKYPSQFFTVCLLSLCLLQPQKRRCRRVTEEHPAATSSFNTLLHSAGSVREGETSFWVVSASSVHCEPLYPYSTLILLSLLSFSFFRTISAAMASCRGKSFRVTSGTLSA